jgi:putative ATP-binding cassette transporter
MKILAAFVALFSIAAAIVGITKGEGTTLLLAVAAGICAFTTYRTPGISTFLRIFAAIFAIETVLFGVIFLIGEIGFWPASLEDYVLPESLPITMALFAILVYALSFVSVIQSMTHIADRYFQTGDAMQVRIWPFRAMGTKERRLATAMVVALVLINQAQVALHVRLSFYYRDLYNALQDKNVGAFWHQFIAVFAPIAFVLVAVGVAEYIVQSTLIIRWRKWLTGYFVNNWLDGSTHYRMTLADGQQTDNPDQRISEDVDRFIDGGDVGYGIYSYSILLISKLSSLVSYTIILWGLSEGLSLPFTTIMVPGLLFWLALSYAAIGSVVTHLIGRPLINLAFMRQRYEADFRFKLARLREYGEQVALLHGEGAERGSLAQSFSSIVRNYFDIVGVRKSLLIFTSTYGQIGTFLPIAFTVPFYFSGKMSLGVVRQAWTLFDQVSTALTFFIDYYVTLANFKAVLDRLTSFEASIASAKATDVAQGLRTRPQAALEDVDVEGVELRLPDGREIVTAPHLRLAAHEAALFTGPSGSGKSTLFRAVSGIWPFGEGAISLPANANIMVLPQKPYLPIGALRAAVTYPAPSDRYDDAAIRAALTAALLPNLTGQLHVEDVWSQRLSGGEQQRLAIARALLVKPDWLFLDEATAAMDENMEAEIYRTLFEALPNATIISVGHRKSLEPLHARQIEMRPAGDGVFTPVVCSAQPAQ